MDEKCIQDVSGKLAYVEFPWCEEDFSEADPILRPRPVFIQMMVEKSISKMEKDKAPGPSGVETEIL